MATMRPTRRTPNGATDVICWAMVPLMASGVVGASSGSCGRLKPGASGGVDGGAGGAGGTGGGAGGAGGDGDMY
eukprot:CAMPEP_0119348994 /NCGR_PEP_ID=MMETSP1333-20130426/109327_1 /TAXON_ID=418940 /ORGANISM="Scyphosphaera apsteinii, Strain RCC1455" /LENGTH=73 /DNA_ID=CAMNT_0007361587 /DNA_START=1053 /DNA_END=1274 /DNA_ORIENTATION=+